MSEQKSLTDVLIITALKDELDILKTCKNEAGDSWEECQDSLGYSYYKTNFKHIEGGRLTIAATSALDMRESPVAALATRLITELKPRILAMTGVCAGENQTCSGDVIVADRVFTYDYGKLKARYEQGEGQEIRSEEIFHDITTYNLKPLWKSKIKEFNEDWIDTIQKPRPKSYKHQERWLIHKLYDYQKNNKNSRSLQEDPERSVECPDWGKVIEGLEQKDLLKLNPFGLTEAGISEVEDERLRSVQEDRRYKDNFKPKVHIGVIATGSYVVEDPKIFERLKKIERRTLGLEMESAAIGMIAEIHEIPMIVVKSVQDRADHGKNDLFRDYAAETSARFLLAFLTTSPLFLDDSVKSQVYQSQPLITVYDPNSWIERTEVTNQILSVLNSPCRILVISGISGIGKTALAERLILEDNNVQSTIANKRQICRLNFNNGGIIADFNSGGAAFLRSLGEEPTKEDQKDPKTLLAHVLKLLIDYPYCVQIDSLELLLKGNEEEGWSNFQDKLWKDLFQQLLSANDCQSQLIITTQDIPEELESIGHRYPRLWYSQTLEGLNEAEQLQLFEKNGLSLDADSQSYLTRIGKLYEGHPLVLQVISRDILVDGGNVRQYWGKYKFAELESAHTVKFLRRSLRSLVKNRVEDSLNRLPVDALQLLCRASAYRCSVPESFWLALIPELGVNKSEATLESLKSRFFAHKEIQIDTWLNSDNENFLKRQHHLIRNVANELLRKNESVWKDTECKAAELWLNKYEPAPNVEQLETVRGYLEGFYHYCEAKDWEEASNLLLRPQHKFNNQIIATQLNYWGYYQNLIYLCKQLLMKTTKEVDAQCWLMIANAYFNLGKFKGTSDDNAWTAYENVLNIAKDINSSNGQAKAFVGLGTICHILDDFQEAIKYQEQALKIFQESEDRQNTSCVLGNLGFAYRNLGDLEQAISYNQQALDIAIEINDWNGQASELNSMGIIYQELGEFQKAIKCHEKALVIFQDNHNPKGMSNNLASLGKIHKDLEEFNSAIEYYEKSLVIYQKIGDLRGKCISLGHLASVHHSLKQYRQARGYCNSALELAKELSIPLIKHYEELLLKIEEDEGK
jgi:nucleoside phosphorylase/tetratricopeptide (TPR) repeat protein